MAFNEKSLTDKSVRLLNFLCRPAYSSIEIASVGQTSAHEPQSVHNSGSIE